MIRWIKLRAREIPCELLEVCAERTGTGIRGLETTPGVGSLVGSVDPVTRRVPAEIPFAPPIEGVTVLGVVCSGSVS